jgi:hypothetical protein
MTTDLIYQLIIADLDSISLFLCRKIDSKRNLSTDIAASGQSNFKI